MIIDRNKKKQFKYFFKIADGGRSDWIGDGFCDDMNNQELCDFDSGDCCGAFTKIHFCIQCRCIRKLRLEIFYSDLPQINTQCQINACKVLFSKNK